MNSMRSENKSPYEERRDAYINLLLGGKAYWADKTRPEYVNEYKRIRQIVEVLIFKHSQEMGLAWRTGRSCLLDDIEGEKGKITLGSFLYQVGVTEHEPTPGATEME